MKKIIAFIIVLSLSAIIIFLRFIVTPILNRLAGTERGLQDRFTVSGEVEAIENGIVSLKDPNGQIFKIAPSDNLKGIQAGDRVTVKDVDGWSVSIEKIGKAAGHGLNRGDTNIEEKELSSAKNNKEVQVYEGC